MTTYSTDMDYVHRDRAIGYYFIKLDMSDVAEAFCVLEIWKEVLSGEWLCGQLNCESRLLTKSSEINGLLAE